MSGRTSHPNIPLKTLPRLPLLLKTDGSPLGWKTSLSNLLETLLEPSVDILSSKNLPTLSLNSPDPFLDNHVSFLYAS